jgi:ribosomal protein S27AE
VSKALSIFTMARGQCLKWYRGQTRYIGSARLSEHRLIASWERIKAKADLLPIVRTPRKTPPPRPSMETVRAMGRRRYQRDKERRKALMREYYRTHKEVGRAHNAVHKAVKDGRITKPERCEKCGAACVPIAHHGDYSMPLQVEWLCGTCHNLLHGKGEALRNYWKNKREAAAVAAGGVR